MKYELKQDKGSSLFRVVALRSGPWGDVGTVGGLVSGEHSLSQHGNAWVYGSARVCGDACVSGDARVYGDAMVYGDARVYGKARVYGGLHDVSPLYIQGSVHALTHCAPGMIAIGCQARACESWLRDYKEIGKSNGYSEQQIEEYSRLIAYMAAEIKIREAK